MDAKQRIDYIIDYSGMNASTFGVHIGLPSPQSFYDIRNGKHEISKRLAKMIHEKYSNFNIGWILTGKGEIFASSSKINENEVSDYPVEYNRVINLPQKDFSTLVETLSKQQSTIDTLSKTIESISEKKDGNNKPNDIAGTA